MYTPTMINETTQLDLDYVNTPPLFVIAGSFLNFLSWISKMFSNV